MAVQLPGAGGGGGGGGAITLTSQALTTPISGSRPKNSLVHSPDPVIDFSIQALPAPYRTVCVPVTLKPPPSTAKRLQVAAVADTARARALGAAIASAGVVALVERASGDETADESAPPPPPPPPQAANTPENKTVQISLTLCVWVSVNSGLLAPMAADNFMDWVFLFGVHRAWQAASQCARMPITRLNPKTCAVVRIAE